MTVSRGGIVLQQADSNGPVCAECRHVEKVGTGFAWTCGAVEATMTTPAMRHPVTGHAREAEWSKVRCWDKNGKGDCEDFARGDGMRTER